MARAGPAPARLGLWHDEGSFTCLGPLWPLPPPAHQPAFSLACVLPLSSVSLVTGKFPLQVIEPVTSHPVWLLRGTKGRRVRMYRPTPDRRARNQHTLNTQVHKHTHRSQSWAGRQSLSVHRDQHFWSVCCAGKDPHQHSRAHLSYLYYVT